MPNMSQVVKINKIIQDKYQKSFKLKFYWLLLNKNRGNNLFLIAYLN